MFASTSSTALFLGQSPGHFLPTPPKVFVRAQKPGIHTRYVFDKRSGSKIEINLNEADILNTTAEDLQDTYRLASHDPVLNKIDAAAARHEQVLRILGEARKPVQKNNSYRYFLQKWTDEELYHQFAHDPTHALTMLYEDELRAHPNRLKSAAFQIGKLISEKSALQVHEHLFPLFDQLQWLSSRLQHSASHYLGLATKPLYKASEAFERILIDPAVPIIKRIKTFSVVAAQEFFSFAILTPALTSAVAMIAPGMTGSDPLTWFQYGAIFALSVVISPFLVQGLKDGFRDDENWQQYFLQNTKGELLKNDQGQLIPNYKDWGNRAKILAHAVKDGGLVRSAKVAGALFPNDVPLLSKIPVEMLPKSYGDWAAFAVELATDVSLYMAYFGIYAMSDVNLSQVLTGNFESLGNISFETGLAFKVTWISVLAYCVTAPEIGRKFSKYKATWIRQVFSVLKNPAVMIAGSGALSEPQALAFISLFSFALWAWARYGFQEDPELKKHLQKPSSDIT